MEEYLKAMRQGQKEAKAAAAQGLPEGLELLPDDQVSYVARRESMGIVDIPMDLIAGTCNAMRRDAFSPGFLPVLPADTEFAGKWRLLCEARMNEGISSPIKAVEYMNRYFVQEGHKRVSVLKYFGAASVPGVVTRLYPYPSEDPRVTAYYEFLDFYRLTGMNFLVYRTPGEYAQLLEAVGYSATEPWSAEEIDAFRSFYYMFQDACCRVGMSRAAIPEALLVYIKVFGYAASLDKLSTEIAQELPKLRQETQNRAEKAGVTLMLDDAVKKPFISLALGGGKVCAAFIHDGSAAASKWIYHHEYARHILEHALREHIQTLSYENVGTGDEADAAIEDAVVQGADVIFTTTPRLLLNSVRQAVQHPNVKILNCSLNTAYPSVRTYYPRMYEAKFIKGAIAGTLSRDGRVGYVADYPTYGSIAGINAFALGVRMVNAQARIYLEWSTLREGGGFRRLRDAGLRCIDNLDRLVAGDSPPAAEAHSLALVQCRWAKLYLSIIRRVMEGTWKQENRGVSAINYWWGLNQSVVNVLCSRELPTGSRRLAEILRDAIQNERLDPFYGELRDQKGELVHYGSAPLQADQILTMNWLGQGVEDRIPELEELTDKAQELVKLQGVERRV